jgi:hypothetical protein
MPDFEIFLFGHSMEVQTFKLEYLCRMLIISTHWREASTGTTGIAGGNYQIFDKFIIESGANITVMYTLTHLWVFVDYYAEIRANHSSVRYLA